MFDIEANQERIVHLGNELKNLRKSNKINSVSFSQSMGLSRLSLKKIEDGNVNSSLYHYMVAYDLLGKDVDFVIQSSDESINKKINEIIEICEKKNKWHYRLNKRISKSKTEIDEKYKKKLITLGRIIRAVREHHKKTMEEIAEKMEKKCTRQTYQLIEDGLPTTSVYDYFNVFNILNIQIVFAIKDKV